MTGKPKTDVVEVERICEYPLDIILEEVDQKAMVVFGEKDGVKLSFSSDVILRSTTQILLGITFTGINGSKVSGTRFFVDDTEHNILKYLEDESNFPVNSFLQSAYGSLLRRFPTNEKIILSSMFHSLFTIAVQLSPAARSSGIEVMETTQFRLSCLQSRTGVKFVVVTSPSAAIPIESLLNKLYELYADYALKNPFYAIDMPIRCSKFEEGLKLLLERVDKNSTSVTI
ncbi:Sybindin-like family protein [Cooperia oncophora]